MKLGLLAVTAFLSVGSVYAACDNFTGTYVVKDLSQPESELQYIYRLEQTGCETLKISLMDVDTPHEMFNLHLNGQTYDTPFNSLPPFAQSQVAAKWVNDSEVQIDVTTLYCSDSDEGEGVDRRKHSRQTLTMLANGNVMGRLEKIDPETGLTSEEELVKNALLVRQ